MKNPHSGNCYFASRSLTAVMTAIAMSVLAFFVNPTTSMAPDDLSNFQGIHACSPSVLIGRPKTNQEVARLIDAFPRVKASGLGHSWWQEQFCSGDDSSAVNIMMTDIARKRMSIDESARTVLVSAGVSLWDLLEFLAASGSIQSGWTLKAFPWFTHQTVGGAVATCTHGSSLSHGSLCSQVVELKVALPNATVAKINYDNYPELMNAMLGMVGRLGVITDVTLSLMPNYDVQRTITYTNLRSFVGEMEEVQRQYTMYGMEAPAVKKLDGRQYFWHIPADSLHQFDYQPYPLTADMRSKPSSEVVLAEATGGSAVGLQSVAAQLISQLRSIGTEDAYTLADTLRDVAIEPNSARPRVINIIPFSRLQLGLTQVYSRAISLVNRIIWQSGRLSARNSYLSQNVFYYNMNKRLAVYDQYEIGVPLSKAGDCFRQLNKKLNPGIFAPRRDQLTLGLPIPALIRFSKAEDAYLSPANNQAIVYVNIEDYYTHGNQENGGQPNEWFEEVMKVFRGPDCDGRLHWGKAGWPQYASNFDGSKEYPDSWCNFGCFVRDLDPSNKFQSVSNVWAWDTVELGRCCVAGKGFSYGTPGCTCKSPR